jgi:hypothetical protein
MTSTVLYSESNGPKWLKQYVVGDVIGEGCYGKVLTVFFFLLLLGD